MNLHSVSDIDMLEVERSSYDLALFASGYEERAPHIAKSLSKRLWSNAVVLGFNEVNSDKQRLENDEYFKKAVSQPIPLQSNDDGVVYKLLRDGLPESASEIRILIDYSSMSRIWYTAVLNWARFCVGRRNIFIDFLYSVGDHREPAMPLVISEIMSLPGCEGLPRALAKSIAVFGLGFEGSAAFCVLDKLEPDMLYSYMADPAAFPEYPERTRHANQAVIELSESCLRLPLFSVERCFASLAELVSADRGEKNITLVPMGPKPHVLAAILTAMRFEEITCLRVGYGRHRAEDVGTTGTVVASRVQFKAATGRPINR
jgi:hypothetical protein